MKVLEGKLIIKAKKIAIVVSRFNEFITNRLLAGAIDTLKRHGASEEDINVIWTPGAYEMPYTAKKFALTKKYDAVICLGAVIRGDTPHFDYISSEVSKGIAQTALELCMPIIFGVITADTLEQAIDRAGSKSGNKGSDAALTAIEMINLFDNI